MVIEWLKFRVPAEQREKYVQIDAEIWNSALEKYDGFMGKEVWISPDDTSELILVIRWASREQWKAIDQVGLDKITRAFDQALGFEYEMLESKEYQVRRFLSS
ncbi:MAG: TIGR03792 family protein [Leptolyngbya sp. SIO4C5]|uniref:TIGR03792 family protein n=1 Tax=Sphaerothrix gracilis TaxID=3151835 RepID=UPI0013C21CF0|nr:TIGR03792 family protein [Leptolyngbya sp. SIO4C5]